MLIAGLDALGARPEAGTTLLGGETASLALRRAASAAAGGYAASLILAFGWVRALNLASLAAVSF